MKADAYEASRRDMIACGLAAAALAVTSTPANVQPTVNGTVYSDTGGAGVRSLTDRGIPGVLLSNGVDITSTDGDGHWRLPWRAGAHVFVIKPTDWSLPCGNNGLPILSRLLGDTAPNEAIDFALQRAEEPRRFDVALLADTQPQSMLELGYLRDSVFPAVIDSGAVFAINHGDVVFDRPELNARYLDLAGGTGIPWHHCPGNHDMNAGSPASCFDTWKRTFGPCHYAFRYGGVTFILLNNVERLAEGTLTAGGYDYRGCIGREQLTFVRRLLKHIPQDELVVVSMHIPLVGWEHPDDPSGLTADKKELLALLSGRPNTLSLAGHTHTTEHHYLDAKDGFAGPGLHHHHVLTAASGSWWSGPYDASGMPMALSRDGTPRGFHMLEVSERTYRTRFVSMCETSRSQVRLCLEGAEIAPSDGATQRVRLTGSLSQAACAGTFVTANVFDGGPRTQVICKIARRGGTPMPQHAAVTLARVRTTDVAVEAVYMRHREQLKAWVAPAPSSHYWRGRLPCLAVVTDEYDRPSRASFMFEVVA
jgi:C terminal of Calcineurin-like phosphoesterase/Calcineurin-like phosphoesterase